MTASDGACDRDMPTVDCAFCDADNIDRQEIALVNDCRVWMPLGTITEAHLLLMPVRHVARVESLTAADALGFLLATQRTLGVAATLFDAVATNFTLNDGSPAGQSVPHLHVHVWPRTAGSGMNPFTVMAGKSPPGPSHPDPAWLATRDAWRTAFAAC